MTGISPLQSIHKKGLFGNHHHKNESDLLNISEGKNLSVVQIFHYKSSKINLSNIRIENLELPSQNSTVVPNKDTRILWNSPNAWLIISEKKDFINIIKEKCNNENFAVTDISHSRAVITIKGFNAKEVLKKGCPINLNEFKKNNCAGTVFHGINIMIDYIDDKSETFNIITLRSFGESLYHHITDASLEFGYLGT